MEEEKELQQYKRHIKDGFRDVLPDIEGFLNDKPDIWLIYKKTERLTKAMYLITDFLNDNESLKWELRSGAVDLFSHITASLRRGNIASREMVGKVAHLASDISSLVAMAKEVRLISQMNASILREEYRSLIHLVHKECARTSPQSGFAFPNNFFSYNVPSLERENVGDGNQEVSAAEYFKGHNNKRHEDKSAFIKDISTRKKKTSIDGRRNTILQFLKTKGEVNIKDISAVVADCSEKTIQRELMSLMAEGVIERMGQRRWSRYRLILK